MNPAIDAIVTRHTKELDDLTRSGEISVLDRDRIGIVMGSNLGLLIEMSDKAWETAQRIITESRIAWEVLQDE